MPALRRVLLFGSLASGVPTPRSDADLLLEVARTDHRAIRDRIPEALRALAPLPCPLDVFVLTSAEIERFSREGSPLLETILRDGLQLL
jgi:predicted nucleotidyltransferase